MPSEPGAAPTGMLPLCVPAIRGREWAYVKDCLDSGWVSSVGAYVDRFEQAMARRVGTKHAVAAVNGTAALQVALEVAGIGCDDEVLVSTLTFIAPVNAIRYRGAWPVFIDAEPEFWQMDPDRVRDFLTRGCEWTNGMLRNKTTRRTVKAIVPVHILGHPADLDPIIAIAREFGLAVIEDSTEGLGAKYRDRNVGQLADIGCFSFNGNKIITTGGGGMIVTDNAAWAARAKYLTTQAKDDPVEFVHGAVGYNFRLTNLQAAVGCAQLESLDEYVAAKRRIAQCYAEVFSGVPGLEVMREAPWARSTYWMFTMLVEPVRFGLDSRALLRVLETHHIQSRPLWQPIHRSPAHSYAAGSVRCPVAERLNEMAISLPCSVGLVAADQQRVIDVVLASARGGGASR